jgi:very-short-patch-repair endonuclease
MSGYLAEGGGYRPDFLWRAARLIVEVDGRAHHARRAAFEHDRRRDRQLAPPLLRDSPLRGG